MREALRRQLPQTQAWGPLLIVGGVVALLVVGWFAWRAIAGASPSRLVKSVIAAVRDGDDETVRASLSEASLASPDCDAWLDLLAGPLEKPGTTIVGDDSMGREAKVYVSVAHRSGSGDMTTSEVPVCAVREGGRWKIDLPATMSSNNVQIWVTVQTEAQ